MERFSRKQELIVVTPRSRDTRTSADTETADMVRLRL